MLEDTQEISRDRDLKQALSEVKAFMPVGGVDFAGAGAGR